MLNGFDRFTADYGGLAFISPDRHLAVQGNPLDFAIEVGINNVADSLMLSGMIVREGNTPRDIPADTGFLCGSDRRCGPAACAPCRH